ncbi:Secretory carrier membrane protein [Ceraceosorus bombacis]|uniref:Secretory carrier membrane protein n=1 Tax=Ceraceosorus bombacis TaxID=401625 RepID=A0A0N7LAV2_9BASI|nr:Secretory carrier membrane protein [Ceraceosorus bombacis]
MANPFSDRGALDANPFADPAVQGALSSGQRTFEPDEPYNYGGGGASVSTPKSAFDDDAPEYPSSAARGTGGGQSSAQMEEIRRREEALARREAELEQRAETIRKVGRNNWPFFFPLIYHDISSEIPPASQQVVTHLYWLWLLLLATLIVNVVACVFLIGRGADGIKDIITSAIYLPVIGVLSFLTWYRPIYNGFMKEHSIFYYLYFVCGFHLVFSLYLVLGIPATGSAGLMNTIYSFTDDNHRSIVAGILGIIVTIGFAAQGLGNLWYYRLIWKHNKEQGHTFAQAKSEFATHGAKAYFSRGNNV